MLSGAGERGALALGYGGQRGFQHPEAFVELRIADHQRHQDAHHVAVAPGGDGDQAVLVAILRDFLGLRIGRLARLRVAHQLDGAHPAEPAHVAYQRPLLLPAAGAFFEALADGLRTLQQPFFLDDLHAGQRRGASQRIAGERPAQPTHPRSVHDLRAPRDSADRQPAAQRLRAHQQVRLDAQLFAGEERARAPEARLHFVGDEHDSMLSADLLQHPEELPGRRDEAPFAEHRLDDDRGHRFRRHHALEGVLQVLRAGRRAPGILQAIGAAVAIGVGNPVDVAGERLEPRLVRMRLAGQRHGQQRPPVKGVLEADHRGPLGVRAGDLDGVLDALRAAVHQERLFRELARRPRVQLLGDLDVALIRRHAEAHVQKLFHLLAQRRQNPRRAVPHVQAADPAGEIQKAVAIHVLEHRTFRARHEDRRGVKRPARHRRGAPLHQGARARPGNFRA